VSFGFAKIDTLPGTAARRRIATYRCLSHPGIFWSGDSLANEKAGMESTWNFVVVQGVPLGTGSRRTNRACWKRLPCGGNRPLYQNHSGSLL